MHYDRDARPWLYSPTPEQESKRRSRLAEAWTPALRGETLAARNRTSWAALTESEREAEVSRLRSIAASGGRRCQPGCTCGRHRPRC